MYRYYTIYEMNNTDTDLTAGMHSWVPDKTNKMICEPSEDSDQPGLRFGLKG